MGEAWEEVEAATIDHAFADERARGSPRTPRIKACRAARWPPGRLSQCARACTRIVENFCGCDCAAQTCDAVISAPEMRHARGALVCVNERVYVHGRTFRVRMCAFSRAMREVNCKTCGCTTCRCTCVCVYMRREGAKQYRNVRLRHRRRLPGICAAREYRLLARIYKKTPGDEQVRLLIISYLFL